MNRFDKMFSHGNKVRLVPFFTLGDPSYDDSLLMIKAAIDAGADALELGFPFSDPVADGPTNQRSMARGLKSNMNVDRCLALLKEIRAYNREIPIGLLIYYNLLFKRGDKVYQELADCGVDGVVSADLPYEEAFDHKKKLEANGVGCVQLVAPNTPLERAKMLFDNSSAFTYVLSGYGPTGAKEKLEEQTIEHVQALRQLTNKPMIVGFGISKPEHVKMICQAGANAAIVGSFFTSMIEKHLNEPAKAREAVSEFIRKVHLND
ncbi:tryptophan synthase subunit alpha [Thiotrichales bacterium 19S3-7]|nr:tryptophan synthase subunit alpha [Thiotrichales bacterium 19S3-7]MCF6802452.1 tryptophan synthase subunit alpha [Thiotrichales bacterium 19S3-11]